MDEDGFLLSPLGDVAGSLPQTPAAATPVRRPLFQAPRTAAPHLGADGLVSASDAPLHPAAPLEEPALVEQLVWLLLGLPSTHVNGASSVAVAAVGGEARAGAVGRLVPVALAYVRVLRALDAWRSLASSRVLPALAFAVHTQLQPYRAGVAALEAQHARQGLTLARLMHHAHELAPRALLLDRVCAALGEAPEAAAALDALHAMHARAVDATERAVLRVLFNGACAPYVAALDMWMDAGVMVPDARGELALTAQGFPRDAAHIPHFVRPVLQHVAAAGRYANALERTSPLQLLPFDVAAEQQWQAAVRAKCAVAAAQVGARLRDTHLGGLLRQLHTLCATARCSAMLETALGATLDGAVLDAPPMHVLEKRVADVTGVAAVRVSVRPTADPSATVRQHWAVSATVTEHVHTLVVGREALDAYSALFASGHRLVHLRVAVADLFVETRRRLSHSCRALGLIRLSLALLGAVLDNAVFFADAALAALLGTLEAGHSLEHVATAHQLYLARCRSGALLGTPALEVCLETVEAFVLLARRVFASPDASRLATLEPKATTLTQLLSAAALELGRHVLGLAERDAAWVHLSTELGLMSSAIA